MELKLLRFEGMTEEEFSFNRTFMELKFGRILSPCSWTAGFNRTFMELKFNIFRNVLGSGTF